MITWNSNAFLTHDPERAEENARVVEGWIKRHQFVILPEAHYTDARSSDISNSLVGARPTAIRTRIIQRGGFSYSPAGGMWKSLSFLLSARL